MEIKIKIYLLIIFLITFNSTNAQDVNCKVIVNANAISGVDAGVFKTLQQSLTDFINQRKWTTDEYASAEKIDCSFQLTLTKKSPNQENTYSGTIVVQASRPVYGTDYMTPILNAQDKDVLIRYVQFQPIDFNENRITGSDAYTSNLSALFAYYTYLIIGLNQDSYKLKAGTSYFTKAQNIVSNAPEGSGIIGWKSGEAKNRYWKIDNILNTRFSAFREMFYNYHRNGLDQMYKTPTEALSVIQNGINTLYNINQENPNTALFSQYFSTKAEEYMQIIPQFNSSKKEEAISLISIMDIANANKYRALLK